MPTKTYYEEHKEAALKYQNEYNRRNRPWEKPNIKDGTAARKRRNYLSNPVRRAATLFFTAAT